MMRGAELALLALLRAALSGERLQELPPLSQEEVQSLFQLAFEHKIMPLIYDAGYPHFQQLPVRQSVRQQAILQTLKSVEFHKLYSMLLDAGLHPVVVKGIVCRKLYPNPDLRGSADEDLWVHPDEFDAACTVLREFGMETTERSMDAYEFPFRKVGSPLYIELHRSLFPPDNQAYGKWNHMFRHVFDSLYTETVDGMPLYTMAPGDHLLYLILHSLKHFMHSGFGIRQVCDICMFATYHGNTIDWDAMLENCNKVNGGYFAAAIFEIGQQYLNFDPDYCGYPASWRSMSVDVEPLLQDLLCSGVYGSSSVTRMHSSNITLDAVADNLHQGRGRASIFGSVFPSAKKLEARFPYLRGRHWLVPFAWAQRLLQYCTETKSSDVIESVQIGSQRVELLRQYGVIK
jgi:hypothetical protein